MYLPARPLLLGMACLCKDWLKVCCMQELITALADECDQSDLPSDYGGTSPYPLYQSKIETEMREFVHNLG